MSRKIGKEKGWGSRTGRTTKRKIECAVTSELESADLSDEILKTILTVPSELHEAIKEILAKRERVRTEHGPAKVAFKTKLGTLFNGDCLRVLEKLEDESIDCIFADPPFNLSKEYENGKSDRLSDSDYWAWTREWLDLCCAKLKTGGAFYVYNLPKWATLIASHLAKKITFRHWIAVDITFSMPIPSRLYPSHYALLYFIKGGRPNRFTPPRLPMETCPRCGKELHDYGGYKMKMNPQGISLRDVWVDIPPVRHSKYKNRDANELSLKLLDRVLDISTQEGDLVFDPFGGSGTTFVAAELKRRKWIGAELGDCSSIVERFKSLERDHSSLERYRLGLNQLFTDKALMARHKHGLPLDNYRVSDEQIRRVIRVVSSDAPKNQKNRQTTEQSTFPDL